ncbi:energy transducer TonB [Paraburkholderia sp. EG285A]|uniref:energy transducer TonB n=1 Tax=Paraburkholderia sp. EG285A TaxID=3237009 RepID=UPI0034D2E3C7
MATTFSRAAQTRASAHRAAYRAASIGTGPTPHVPAADTTQHLQRTAQPPETALGDCRTFALTALAVIALHAALVWLAHAWQTHTAARPPQPLPMTVTLTSAPRPLPQAAAAAPEPQPPREAKPASPVAARPVEHHEKAPAPTARPVAAPPIAAAQTEQPAAQQAVQQPAQQPMQQAPAAAAPTHESRPPPTSAPIGNAAYLHNPAPDYPQIAQDQGWEGRVLLRVHVLADGSPDSVAVQTGSGRRVLDEAAREAVAHWRFVPAKRGDEAVEGWVTVPIDFRLAQ